MKYNNFTRLVVLLCSFGSMVIGRRTGIIFNNQMNDFSAPGTINIYGLAASSTNYIVPGKMPMSSMCPTLVLDGDRNVRLLTGAAGGPFLTTHTALVRSHEFFVALYFFLLSKMQSVL